MTGILGGLAMKDDGKAKLGRRDFLRVLGVGAGAAAVPVAATLPANADSETNDEKRKARYDANSADVKAYYRVNQYPAGK
jgi:hypothetical protein